LQNPEFAGNTPFASINAMIQTALGGLNPARALCESAHEELGLRMIEWCKQENKPLLAYRYQKTAKEGEDIGSFVNVGPEQLDPDSLLVTCRLFAEAPTDFQQRLQAAVTMNQALKVPRSHVLESLGKENPELLYEQWAQEQYDDSTIALDIQMEQAKAQMQLQMAAQQAQMQMQGAGAAPQEVATSVGEAQTGMNPNQGAMGPMEGNVTGEPNPAAGNPGVGLREMVSGQDVTGAQIA
jgi:hypothetical protein